VIKIDQEFIIAISILAIWDYRYRVIQLGYRIQDSDTGYDMIIYRIYIATGFATRLFSRGASRFYARGRENLRIKLETNTGYDIIQDMIQLQDLYRYRILQGYVGVGYSPLYIYIYIIKYSNNYSSYSYISRKLKILSDKYKDQS